MLDTAAMLHHSPGTLLDKNDPEKFLILKAIGPAFGILAALWVAYFARKDLFPERSMAYMILAGVSFCVTSASMHTLNKACVGFTHMPSTVTCFQMLVALIVLLGWHWKEVFGADRRQLFRWCLVPFAYAAMLNSSLFGYEYISLTLLTVFRNLAPIVTMAVEGVIMEPQHRPKVTMPIIASLAIMVAGAFLFSYSDSTAFSWIGVGLVALNTLLAIIDRVLQRRLLVQECKDLPFSACMVVNNALGMVPTLALAMGTKELQGYQASAANWSDPGILTLLIMSGFMGLFIGLAGLMCQKAMSATSFQVLQNMSKVIVVSAGVGIFGENMNGYGHKLGMLLSLAGSMAYGYARTLESATDAKKNELAAVPTGDVAYKACKA